MGGAHRRMHRPQRANHPESIQTRHSATPLETPPRRAGKSLPLNHKPAHSTDDAAKMQKFASRYRKNWIVVENGSSEHRTTFPASRPKYDLNRAVCKPNDGEYEKTRHVPFVILASSVCRATNRRATLCILSGVHRESDAQMTAAHVRVILARSRIPA